MEFIIMEKSPFFAIGFIAGLVLVFIVCFIIRIVSVKLLKKSKKQFEYDERQMAARGKASTIGFTVLCFWQILTMCIDISFGTLFMTPALWNFCGLIAGITAFVITCIWKDAYFTQSNKKTGFIIFIIIMTIINIVIFFINGGINKAITEEGLLGTPFTNLFAAIMLLIITINLIVKICKDKKNDTEA